MDPILGQICLFGFDFAPKGWFPCDGRLLPITQFTALFSLLGTTYGGDGRVTFALPDLRGRAPISFGQGNGLQYRAQGEMGGLENVTLTSNEIPTHSHQLAVKNGAGTSPIGSGLTVANTVDTNGDQLVGYVSGTPDTTLSPASITTFGGSQPHNNMQPYLVLNYCIAWQGIFPSRP